MKSPLDSFFKLGGRVTKNDPVRKARFDYYLYWIVFGMFIFLCLNYFYTFFQTYKFSTLGWAFVIGVFCWFNYWGLIQFKSVYDQMKKIHSISPNKPVKKTEEIKVESEEEMLDEFKD